MPGGARTPRSGAGTAAAPVRGSSPAPRPPDRRGSPRGTTARSCPRRPGDAPGTQGAPGSASGVQSRPHPTRICHQPRQPAPLQAHRRPQEGKERKETERRRKTPEAAKEPVRLPHLRQLGDLLAHFEVQVRALLGAQPRLCRARAEFPRAGRGAATVAVLRLLPAHARGRHLHRPAPAAARAPACLTEDRARRPGRDSLPEAAPPAPGASPGRRPRRAAASKLPGTLHEGAPAFPFLSAPARVPGRGRPLGWAAGAARLPGPPPRCLRRAPPRHSPAPPARARSPPARGRAPPNEGGARPAPPSRPPRPGNREQGTGSREPARLREGTETAPWPPGAGHGAGESGFSQRCSSAAPRRPPAPSTKGLSWWEAPSVWRGMSRAEHHSAGCAKG